MALSFLATDAAPSCAAGHQDAEAGLVALGGHQDERHQLAAPGHAVPAGRQGQPSGAELGQLLGHLGRRRRQRHVAQVEGRRGRFRRGGVPRVAAATAASAPLADGPALPGTGSPERAGVEQLLQAAPHRLHLEAVERGRGRGAVPAAERQMRHVDVERDVAHERDDAGVGAGQLLVRRPGSRAASASARRGGRRSRRGRRTW